MISTIIGAIILGAIIGALGRLFVPGKQNISIIVTIIIGIVANVIVTWIVTARRVTPTRVASHGTPP